MTYRGTGRIVGRGRVEVRARRRGPHEFGARNILVAVGSTSKVPPLAGIDDIPYWTNREATLARRAAEEPARPRRRPDRLRARPGLRPVRRARDDRPVGPRLMPDGPSAQRRGDPVRPRARGVTVRTGVRAIRARAGAGTDGAHVIDLDDGTTAEGHAVLLAVGRVVPARGPRARALRHRHHRADAVPARRPAADRGRAVGHRRPGRPRAPHPPGPLPGRDGGPDGARRGRSSPTTGRCRGRRTRTRRRRRSA